MDRLASGAAGVGGAVHHVCGERAVHTGDLSLLGRQHRSNLVGELARLGPVGPTLAHRFAKPLAFLTECVALGHPLGVEGFELPHLGVGEVEGGLHVRHHRLVPGVAALGTRGVIHPLPRALVARAAAVTHLLPRRRAVGPGEQRLFLLIGERRSEGSGDGPEVAPLGLIPERFIDQRCLVVGEVEGPLQPLGAVGSVLGKSREREEHKDGEEESALQESMGVVHRSVGWWIHR